MNIVTKPTQKEVFEAAGLFILGRLEELTEQEREIVLFLSGGSSAYALDYVEANVRHLGEGLPLTVALVDERCTHDHKRKDSNRDFIENETGVLSRLEKQGARLIQPLSDAGDCFMQGDEYHNEIKRLLTSGAYKLAMFGIGADGHTAGIKSLDTKRFEELFLDDEFIAVYDSPDQYEFRITLTGTAFEHLDEGVIVSFSDEKRKALDDFNQAGNADFTLEDYAAHPAWMLHKIPHLTLFTDQQL